MYLTLRRGGLWTGKAIHGKCNVDGIPPMVPPFDLFRVEDDGSVRWLGVCANVDAAKARVVELCAAFPASFFIHSQTSGDRLFILQDGQVSDRPRAKARTTSS